MSGSHVTRSQIEVMVEYMAQNGDISQLQPGLQGRVRAARRWKDLAVQLNQDAAGPQKTVDQWKRTWQDLKSRTKKKVYATQYTPNKAGRPTLTNLEERLLDILGKRSRTRRRAPANGFELKEESQQHSSGDDECAGSAASAQDMEEDADSPASAPDLPESADSPASAPDLPDDAESPTPNNPDHRLPPASRTQGVRPEAGAHRGVRSRRRQRARNPFDNAAALFEQLERDRLLLDRLREESLHEREMLRLNNESRFISVTERAMSLLDTLRPAFLAALQAYTRRTNRNDNE